MTVGSEEPAVRKDSAAYVSLSFFTCQRAASDDAASRKSRLSDHGRPEEPGCPGSGSAEPPFGGSTVMDLIWVHPFPLSTPGLAFVSPGSTRIRRCGSSKDRALIPTEVGRSRPGYSEETSGAVTRQRRRRWAVYRSGRFCLSTPPMRFFRPCCDALGGGGARA